MYDIRQLAIDAHGDQMYGDKPYVYHLDQVWDILQPYVYPSYDWKAAAYFHDAVEDTKWTIADVHVHFGAEVAQMVNAVTGEGLNRRERVNNILSKLRAYPDACVLKLADRIANVETGGKLEMYASEQDAFEHVVRRNVPQPMWQRLEDAFSGGDL